MECSHGRFTCSDRLDFKHTHTPDYLNVYMYIRVHKPEICEEPTALPLCCCCVVAGRLPLVLLLRLPLVAI